MSKGMEMPGIVRIAVLSGLLASAPGLAAETSSGQGAYVGLFGGLGKVGSTDMKQQGMVLSQPIRLPIHATGSTDSTRVHAGGLQVGYEWQRLNLGQSGWGVRPAAEFEAIYIGKHTPVGELRIIPRALGTQYVSVPTTAGVFLANAVFNLQTPYSSKVLPYVAIGAGVARMSIKRSDSANPLEPGINHFNSDPNASKTAFAFQFKAGVVGEVAQNLSLFAEYRHLSVRSTNYTFGATDYPGVHLPTAPWHVSLGRQKFNLFTVGLRYKF